MPGPATLTRDTPALAGPPPPTLPPKRPRRLAPVPDVNGPRVRLGMLWAFVSFTAAIAGAGWLAACVGLVAFSAAAQTSRSWRYRYRMPPPALVGALGGIPVLFATAGAFASGLAAAVVSLCVLAVPIASDLRHGTRRRSLAPGSFVAVFTCLPIAAAAAAPIVVHGLRDAGASGVLGVLALVCAYDAGNFLVGTGAISRWEGPAAGIASIAATGLAVAGLLAPPFSGWTALLLGGSAAVTVPLGPIVASLLMGDDRKRAPALRRLDSLIVFGPVAALELAIVLS